MAPVEIPPLRERKEDIEVLVQYFLRNLNTKYGTCKSLTPNALDTMLEYHWPENVRELENIVERLVVTTLDDVITTHDLPSRLLPEVIRESDPGEIVTLSVAVDKVERQLIEKAYRQYRNTRQMAKALGVHQSTFLRKATKYGITKK